MKKFLKYILLITIFISSFIGTKNVFADGVCAFTNETGNGIGNSLTINDKYNNEYFSTHTSEKIALINNLVDKTNSIEATMWLSGVDYCNNSDNFKFVIMKNASSQVETYNVSIPSNIKNDSHYDSSTKVYTFEKSYAVTLENLCTVNNCSFMFGILKNEGTFGGHGLSSVQSGDKGILNFQYDGDKTNTVNIKFILKIKDAAGLVEDQSTDACTLNEGDVYWTGVGSSINSQNAVLNIKTDKCIDAHLELSLFNKNDSKIDVTVKGNTGKHTIDIFPKEDEVTMHFMSNEEECIHFLIVTPVPIPNPADVSDCEIYVKIKYGDKTFSTKSIIAEYNQKVGGERKYLSDKSFKEKGVIFSNCTNFGLNYCNGDDWVLRKITGDAHENDYPTSYQTIAPVYDPNSPCYVEKGGSIGENKLANDENGYYKIGCYEFLAPLAGIEKDADDNTDSRFTVTNDGRIAINDIRTYKLGDYINKLFQMAIAILGVLAVIMIIVAGVQYMTVESITGKSNAKDRIIGAVSGLLLSLGIFIILNTINPQLLEVNFGDKLRKVKVDVDSAPVVNSDGTYPSHNGGKVTINGVLLKNDDDWIPSGVNWQTLRGINPNIKINKNECTKVGKNVSGGSNCTSVYFDDSVFPLIKKRLNEIQDKCNCKFTISGGSEFWHHSTHFHDAPVVDLSINPQQGTTQEDIKKLNKALSCDEYETLPIGKSGYGYSKGSGSPTSCLPGVFRYAEGTSSTDPNRHWHLNFE